MKQNRKKSVYQEMVITYVVSGLVLTGLLSFAFSRFISSFYVSQKIEVAKESLDVTFRSSESILDDLYSEYYYMFNHHDLMVSYRSNPLESQRLALARLLQAATISDPLVYQLTFFDLRSQRLMTSNGQVLDANALQDEYYLYFIDQIMRSPTRNRFEVFSHRTLQGKPVLSTYFGISNAHGELEYALLVDIDEQSFSSMFASEHSASNTLIVNPSKVVVADSSSTWLGQIVPMDIEVESSMYLMDTTEPMITDFNGIKSLVLIKKSEQLQFAFFHITPYTVVTQAVSQANRWVIALFAIFALMNLVVGIMSAKRFYDPLKKVIQRITQNTQFQKNSNEYQMIEQAMSDLSIQGHQLAKRELLLHGVLVNEEALDIQFPVYVVVSLCEVAMDKDDPFFSSWIMEDVNTSVNLLSTSDLPLLKEYKDRYFGASLLMDNFDDIKKNIRFAHAAAQYASTLTHTNIVLYESMSQSEFATPKTSLHFQIVEYLDEHGFDIEFSFEQMANDLGFSLGYIRQVFKEEEKVALNEYLILRRIEEAKKYLDDTELSGREISEMVGYSDSRYFYTQFKKRVGMTIDSYRKRRESGDSYA